MNETLARRAWWQVSWATLAITAAVASLVLAPFSVLLKPISEEFGWSRSATSGLVSVFALTAAIVVPLVGRLLDKYGTRRVVIPCVLLTAVGLASLALLPASLPLWMTVMGVLGVVSAAVNGMPLIRLGARWVDRHRGMAIGVIGTGMALGQAFSPPLVNLMTAEWGWRGAFIGLAVFAVVVAGLPTIFILRDPTPEESVQLNAAHEDPTAELPGLGVAEALRTRPFWVLLLSTLVIGTAIPGALVHLVSILTDSGVSQERAVAALSMSAVAAMVGRLVGGYLLDRIHAPRVAFVVMIIPVVGFVLLGSGMGMLPLIGALCVGFAMGAESDLVGYLTSRYLGMKSFGTLYGVFYGLLALGYSIGPAIYAWAYDFGGGYRTAYWILGVALGLVSFAVLTLGKYRYGQIGKTITPEPVADETPESRPA